MQALRARQQVILDNIRDNDEAGVNYQKVMLHFLGSYELLLFKLNRLNNLICYRKLKPMKSVAVNYKI